MSEKITNKFPTLPPRVSKLGKIPYFFFETLPISVISSKGCFSHLTFRKFEMLHLFVYLSIGILLLCKSTNWSIHLGHIFIEHNLGNLI